MQSTAVKSQINMRYSDMPRAYLGKVNKNEGAVNYVPSNGARRFTATKIVTLSLIKSETDMFGTFNKMPYSSFISELNMARSTVCRNLKELTLDGVIAHAAQSKYDIIPAQSGKDYVRLYHFLMSELDLGGVKKVLSKNAVIYLCSLIGYYLNPKNKGKHFIGGQKRAAKMLNIAESTAFYMIDELLQVKAIYRKSLTLDTAGNEVIGEGKGINSKTCTTYEVNPSILKTVRKINKEYEDRRNVKAIFKSGSTSNRKQTFKPQEVKAPTVQRTDEQRYTALDKKFAKDSTYQELKHKIITARKEWLKALRADDELTLDDIERRQDELLDELEDYLITSGVAREDLPANITEFIK